jgi:hypothetical protein
MIEFLRCQYGVDRVAIVDTDCHHGDGTQDIYWHDPDTLFISLHQDGRTLYPGSGFPASWAGRMVATPQRPAAAPHTEEGFLRHPQRRPADSRRFQATAHRQLGRPGQSLLDHANMFSPGYAGDLAPECRHRRAGGGLLIEGAWLTSIWSSYMAVWISRVRSGLRYRQIRQSPAVTDAVKRPRPGARLLAERGNCEGPASGLQVSPAAFSRHRRLLRVAAGGDACEACGGAPRSTPYPTEGRHPGGASRAAPALPANRPRGDQASIKRRDRVPCRIERKTHLPSKTEERPSTYRSEGGIQGSKWTRPSMEMFHGLATAFSRHRHRRPRGRFLV